MLPLTVVRHAAFLLAMVVASLLGGESLQSTRTAAAAAAGSTCGKGSEVYYLRDGQDYRGMVNMTESGAPCRLWSSQASQLGGILLDPATGVGDHNYCRNPNGRERPWCFAAIPSGGYEFCKIGPVCTELPPTKPMVLFSPPSGTQLTLDGSHNYVMISCYPRPCIIHYTFGADALASAESPVYTHPLLLNASKYLKAYAVYERLQPIRAQARYAVTGPSTNAPSSMRFIPTDSVVYDRPIFVELQGVTSSMEVLIFWDKDFTNPTMYAGGAFRLAKSTDIVAIVNRTYSLFARYTLNITVPPLSVYPPSGTYVGGVNVLVIDPQPPATYYMYVNRSIVLNTLGTLRFTWDTVGTSELDFRALHVQGIESAERVMYNVVPASPPLILPDPSIVYHRPVNVTCTAPPGKLVPLSVYRDTAMQDAVAKRTFYVVLHLPGEYTVICDYVDDLRVSHTTVKVLQLVAVPMQRPTFIPGCGTKFPAIALSLRTRVNASNLLPGALATSWSVSVSATGGARIPMITRSPDADGVFVYEVFHEELTQDPRTMEIYVTAHSLDPFEADSPRAACSYTIYPLGASSTPFFRAIPSCATAGSVVSASCITALKLELSSCLYFFSTELLSVDALGPMVVIYMTGLVPAIQPELYTRMGVCLFDLQRQGLLSHLQNETSGEIALARWWHVVTPTPMTPEVHTGLPTTVRVVGFGADTGLYHLVRSEYSCEDIGVLPEAVPAAFSHTSAATGSPPILSTTEDYAQLTFRVPIPGQYKLCAFISDILYEVPFRFSSPVSVTSAIAPYLRVVAKPWPSVATAAGAECGGLVPPEREGFAFPLSLAARPAGAFPSLSYARNSGAWSTVLFPIDAATQLGGPVSLSIGPLSRQRQPLEVFDVSFGATSGAAQTCVFFVSAEHSPPQRNLTYMFYLVHANHMPESLTGVMLLLEGQFQPSEMIVIDLYDTTATSVRDGASSSPVRLLRRVTARPSLATSYSVALPDAVLGLRAGAQPQPYLIHATLDGMQVAVTPSAVALSPLVLAMKPCSTCTSGLCYDEQCVCKDNQTKVFSLCEKGAGDKDSHHHDTNSSSSNDSGNGDVDSMKGVSMVQRLTFLVTYLGLLAAIAAYIFIAVKRGRSRHPYSPNNENVILEAM